MVIALGAVALLGGKKIWDFWQKKQELAHEQKMEELKTMKTGHEACVEKQKALEEQLTVLKQHITEIDSKAAAAEKKVAEINAASEEKLKDLKDKISKLKKKAMIDQDSPKDKKDKKKNHG